MKNDDKFTFQIYQALVNCIAESHDIELMANQLTQLLVGTLGIKGAALFILDPVRRELQYLTSTGLSMDYVNKGPVLVDKSISLGLNREMVIIPDVSKSDKLQYPDRALAEGVGAIVSSPIVIRDKVIGALRLYHGAPWDVSESDIAFIQTLAQNVGMALMYFRISLSVNELRDTLEDIHAIWL